MADNGEPASGVAWALLSILLFGSFAVPIKTPAMQQARVHPVIVQVYKSTACFLTSWLVLLLRPFKFSYWGVVGAVIWVLNGIAAIAAVQCAGLGVSQATWSAVTIIVSFAWGTLFYHDNIPHWALALLGITLMTLGVAAVGVLSSASAAKSGSGSDAGGSGSGSGSDHGLITRVNYSRLEDGKGKGSDLEDDFDAAYPTRGNHKNGESNPTPPPTTHTHQLCTLSNQPAALVYHYWPNNKSHVFGVFAAAGGLWGSLSPRARGLCFALYVGVANGSFMVPFKSAIKDSGLDAVEYVLFPLPSPSPSPPLFSPFGE